MSDSKYSVLRGALAGGFPSAERGAARATTFPLDPSPETNFCFRALSRGRPRKAAVGLARAKLPLGINSRWSEARPR